MKKKLQKARIPVQKRGIETKELIQKSAKELFEEKGFHGTNSKEIAARAGVAVGTFYSYYDEKKTLFMDVIRSYYRDTARKTMVQITDTLKEIQEHPDKPPQEILGTIIKALYDAHDISPDLHREITAMIYSDPEIAALAGEEEETIRTTLKGLFKTVFTKASFSNLDAAVYMIHLASEGVIHGLKMFENRANKKDVLLELEDMLYKYLFM